MERVKSFNKKTLDVLGCNIDIIDYRADDDVVAKIEAFLNDGTIESDIYIIERGTELKFKYVNKYIEQFKEKIIRMYKEIKDIHSKRIE